MYNGIEINEARLLANNIIFSLLLLFTIVVATAAYFAFCDKEKFINAARIKALREKAATDPVAKKRLRKMERKHKNRLKNDRFNKILTFSLTSLLIFINLFAAVIPGWTDYIKKDYVVYGGETATEYDVQRYVRTSTVTLDDGTVLTGPFGLDQGKHNERIVYSKRTKIVLGIDK